MKLGRENRVWEEKKNDHILVLIWIRFQIQDFFFKMILIILILIKHIEQKMGLAKPWWMCVEGLLP